MVIKKIRKSEESDQQSAFLRWMSWQYPIAYEVTASFPNAGKRSLSYAMKLKREGLRKGMPDIVIFVPKSGMHGMFIEFKSKTGRLRPEQRMMLARLINNNYCCVICTSMEEAIREVTKYLES